MKVLFDQNLSPRLVSALADIYPGASHVSLLGLDRADDDAVWAFARANGYVIATKDVDFSELSVVRGFPPKVIWLRVGNCTTSHIEALLRSHLRKVKALDGDKKVAVLTLF
jgi:predicted nuclease of predicted toxin-antitoxin system